jgi:nucleotide-binding universal stress UspA family protein
VIVELAAAENSDLIIMGTIGRTGIPGLLIGNTAETVLGQVDCSVLTVKPEGFDTPVRLEQTKGGPS